MQATNNQNLRILLIYPPSRTQTHMTCPVGLLYLGAVLDKSGCQVRLLDANADKRRRTTPDIIRAAEEWKPDVIGMTLLTPLAKEAYHLASGLRGLGVPLLAGGPHASLLPEEALVHGFDAAVIGEGESTIAEAVKALAGQIPKDHVKGWVYRDDQGQIRHAEPRPFIMNLDELPFPARHLIDPSDYGSPDEIYRNVNLFSSRGCPARCAFCSGQMFGKKFRFRSAANVLDEIIQTHRKYGTRHFHFMDDSMTVDQSRVRDICRGLIESKLNLTWSVMTRIDLVTEALLERMAEAGCTQIDYGVESGNPETLKHIHKPHTVEMVRRIVPLTAQKGIKPYVFFILGFPWEDTRSVSDTLNLMVELSAYVDRFHPAIASILIPFPGTEIYEHYKGRYNLANWWLSDDRGYDAPRTGRHSYFETKVFSRGAVLDADFFRYSRDMRRMIHTVFSFMFQHNVKRQGGLARRVQGVLVELSRILYGLSPSLERLVFAPILRVEQAGRRQ